MTEVMVRRIPLRYVAIGVPYTLSAVTGAEMLAVWRLEDITAMNTVVLIVLIAVALVMVAAVVRAAVVVFRRYRGPMSVTCPETHAPVGVEIDRNQVFLTTLFGKPDLRLRDCTRWPRREKCQQACLSQIEASPVDCMVKTKLVHWYAGKSCAFCGESFGEINWHDHKPALLSPAGDLLEWSMIPLENLPSVLQTYRPVCWNCLITKSFIREHPDLVIFNPWQPAVKDLDEELA
jgi:hypothetical protein